MESTGKYITWKRLAGAACVTVFLAVLLVGIFAGGGRGKEDGTELPGPEQVLSEFYSALVAGDMDAVRSYCDTTAAVMDYADRYMQAAAGLMEREPGALSVISGMVKTEVTGKRKGKSAVRLEFTLYLSGDGQERSHSKYREAEMRQENGKWLVADITER